MWTEYTAVESSFAAGDGAGGAASAPSLQSRTTFDESMHAMRQSGYDYDTSRATDSRLESVTTTRMDGWMDGLQYALLRASEPVELIRW
jgi:hypothetical protein